MSLPAWPKEHMYPTGWHGCRYVWLWFHEIFVLNKNVILIWINELPKIFKFPTIPLERQRVHLNKHGWRHG